MGDNKNTKIIEEKNYFVSIIKDKTNKDNIKSYSVFQELPNDISFATELSRQMKSYHIPSQLKYLEVQIEKFQKLKFPDLSLPKLNNKKKKRKKYKSTERTTSSCPLKKVDIPSSLLPSPTPDFKLPKINNNSIGPGSYFSDVKEALPGSYIPRVPRFLTSFEEKISHFIKKKDPLDNGDLFHIIEKRNKNLEKFSPDARERYSKEKVKENEMKIKIQKKAKEILEENEKKIREEKYLDKVNKYK